MISDQTDQADHQCALVVVAHLLSTINKYTHAIKQFYSATLYSTLYTIQRQFLGLLIVKMQDQGVYKFNQANFQEITGGILRKIQDVCLASASFGGDIGRVFLLSVSPPQPNRNLGEHHKLPHRGPGQSPGRKRVLVHLELERTHLMVIHFVFLRRIFIHIFMTGNQCGRSLTSYTKISRRTN